ncbi:hypothetical protein D3C83_308070 [compost metagenome]
MGDFGVVYMEADDPGAVLAGFMTSEDPHDKWFRETVLQGVHGIDPAVAPPPPNDRIF